MKVGLAQLNPTIGDLSGNAERVADAAARLAGAGAELVVTSELVISGYPPKDLLLRDGFAAACDAQIDQLAQTLADGPAVLVGHPTLRGMPAGCVANAVSLLADGRVQATRHKLLLPNYDVFDERRYFRPAEQIAPIPFRGRQLGVHICEDAWWGEPGTFHESDPYHAGDPVAMLAAAGADVLINLSASPYERNKRDRRLRILRDHVLQHRLACVFVNQTGGNDDLVFDGNSFVFSPAGELVALLPAFETGQQVIDLAQLPGPVTPPARPEVAGLLDALELGLKDYMRRCGFTECVLGLSGGIDSALAAAIAARAIGPENVHCLLMPSRYSTDHSVNDARQMAETVGMPYEIVPIDAIHRAYEGTEVIAEDLSSQPGGLADQNLQARIRGAMVMVRSNRHGWLPLATGNKSELAMGYCTLYGDMAGGFAVLSDVYKRDVYAMSRLINTTAGRELIPENILTKAPSAELAPNQFDQDVLPEYDLLDAILEGLIEREESVVSLSRKFPADVVQDVARRLDRNEFKRRQLPPGIKLSQRAFGSGRRMPIAARLDASLYRTED